MMRIPLMIALGSALTVCGHGEDSPAEAPSLKVGSPVTTEVFADLDWIQGEGPKEWEPGKVYLFECWATWCGPCIAAIPHVNELHVKYEGQGLRVYGIDVWEDGRDKVAGFVKKKGDGMSYPVAYTGKGGSFELEWLKPAGIGGIPHTFVVQDGKILLLEHPSALTEELIEGLLAGGDAKDTALAGLSREKEDTAVFRGNQRKFGGAIRSGKLEVAAEALEGMKKLEKGRESQVHMSSIELAIAQEDWEESEALLDSIPKDRYESLAFRLAATSLVKYPDAPQSLLKKTLDGYREMLESREGPEGHQNASILFWRLGEKENAIAEARKAEQVAKGDRYAKVGFSSEPYRKFAESLEGGELPDENTRRGWTKEAHGKLMKKRKAKAAEEEEAGAER